MFCVVLSVDIHCLSSQRTSIEGFHYSYDYLLLRHSACKTLLHQSALVSSDAVREYQQVTEVHLGNSVKMFVCVGGL